ncbi:MAG: hypothetical protein K2Y42_00325 [Hyphomicrobium sp.]|jgi:hypothetical protein|uniref:ribbon-helix-helix domain-containing protein n=1 Tax=Hyphomicrobium sp. TaxID=82 RepID=UPI0025C2F8E4|nr:ribbon-helix-helix domain-containing protein [Hyphomicrobium sp.]MBX9861169.1 hypothetical protein [Hyphomicrobium sp.]
MKQQNKLREAMRGLQTTAEQPAAQGAETAQPPTWKTRPTPSTRVNRRAVTVWISPEAYRQLHLIGLDTDASVQDMGVEAVNDFFRKHNKSAVA